MSTAQNPITQRDYVKPVQSTVEGNTPATYGITPVNPSFVCHGQDATIVENITPETVEKRLLGEVDRQGADVLGLTNLIVLKLYLMEADKSLVKWLTNKPNGAGTPDESRTFLYSAKDSGGTEKYHIYKGCKPQSCTINGDKSGYLTLEATLSFKDKLENTSGPTLGSGSLGTALTGTPLSHKDNQSSQVVYDGNAIHVKSASVSVEFEEAFDEDMGPKVPLYRKPSLRTISGSMTVVKKDSSLQNDATTAAQKIATWTPKAGFVLTFTRFRFLPSGEEVRGNTSEATMENKSFESDELLVA